jgi:hypothetical protein
LGVDETHAPAIRKRCLFFRVVRDLLPSALRGAANSGGIEVTVAMTEALAASLDAM